MSNQTCDIKSRYFEEQSKVVMTFAGEDNQSLVFAFARKKINQKGVFEVDSSLPVFFFFKKSTSHALAWRANVATDSLQQITFRNFVESLHLSYRHCKWDNEVLMYRLRSYQKPHYATIYHIIVKLQGTTSVLIN